MLGNAGSRIHYRTLATGVFHCERCGGDRPYRHRTGRRWVHLLVLPLFPLERTGEHLRCVICHTCYRIELLAVPTVEQMQAALLAATTAASLAMLSAGGAASNTARRAAIEQITNAGSPRYAEPDLVLALAGSGPGPLAEKPVTCGPVPGLRTAIDTVAIQLDLHAKEWFLGRMVQVGLADGPLSDAEREAVGTVARHLGLSQAQARDVILLTEEAAAG